MVKAEKCEEHSGVCKVVEHLSKESQRQWDAIERINGKLWLILVLAAAGAIGALLNLVLIVPK
jgi:hypothetical protein